MPVYNGADTLSVAIDSIMSQHFTEWELILINDGSTDNSFDIGQKYSQEDTRIHLFTMDHQGIAAALNKGLSMSKGKYIARMDADDISFPQRLEKQKEFLDRNEDTGLVSCLIEYGKEEESESGYGLHVNWLNKQLTHQEMFTRRFIDAPVAHPSVMFRKSLIEKYGGYNTGQLPEDYELWLRWMAKGVKFGKVPLKLFRWNDPPNRLSRIHSNYSQENFFKVKAKYLAAWLKGVNIPIIIWGAGRKTRRRVEFLKDEGIKITAYVDVKIPIGGKDPLGIPIIHFRETDKYFSGLIISYVSNRGVRAEIKKFLESHQKQEGKHFVFAG